MSKSMIQAFALAQLASLISKDNKGRLKYTIAGCKDGHLYDHNGQDYGLFNADAPDTVFIPESDLELSRITGVKLEGIAKKASAFFDVYGADPKDEGAVEREADEPTEEQSDPEPTGGDVDKTDEAVDYDALEKACKKAIKKGNMKKATKLLVKLEGQKCHKKLSKKVSE